MIFVRLSNGATRASRAIPLPDRGLALRDAVDGLLAEVKRRPGEHFELQVRGPCGGWFAPLAPRAYVQVFVTPDRPADDWGDLLDWCVQSFKHGLGWQAVARQVADDASDSAS